MNEDTVFSSSGNQIDENKRSRVFIFMINLRQNWTVTLLSSRVIFFRILEWTYFPLFSDRSEGWKHSRTRSRDVTYGPDFHYLPPGSIQCTDADGPPIWRNCCTKRPNDTLSNHPTGQARFMEQVGNYSGEISDTICCWFAGIHTAFLCRSSFFSKEHRLFLLYLNKHPPLKIQKLPNNRSEYYTCTLPFNWNCPSQNIENFGKMFPLKLYSRG